MIRIHDLKDGIRAATDKLAAHEGKARGTSAGISTSFSGTTAYAVWSDAGYGITGTINLPAMPDQGVLSRPEADRLTGYVLHELGHVFHTDLDAFKAEAARHPFRKALLNGLEDPRIEGCVIESGQAPGARHCLSVLVKSLLAKSPAGIDAGDVKNAPFAIAVLGRAVRWGMDLPDGIVNIPESMAPFYDLAMDGVRSAPAGRAGTVALQQTVQQLIDWLDQQRADGDGEPAEQGEPGNPGEQGEPAEQGEEAGERGEQTGEQPGEPSDGQGEGEQGGEQGGQGESAELGEPEGGGAGCGGDYRDLTDDSITPVEPDQSIDDLAKRLGGGPSPDGCLSGLGSAQVCDAPEPTRWSDRYDRHLDAMEGKVGVLSQMLGRLLVSPERCGWDTQRTSGRFDVRRATRAVTGAEAVFKQRWEVPGLTTDVILLIDQSSSMTGTKEAAAAAAACAITAALDRLAGVSYAALGFGDETHVYAYGGEGMRGQHGGSVCEAKAVLLKLKGFEERLGKRQRKLLSNGQSYGGTPDRSAIKGCAEILQRRGASRRVLLVLTDGMGDIGTVGTRAAVRYAEQCGVDVIGIGIRHDVSGPYPVSATVNNLADLTGTTMRLLVNRLSAKQAA